MKVQFAVNYYYIIIIIFIDSRSKYNTQYTDKQNKLQKAHMVNG